MWKWASVLESIWSNQSNVILRTFASIFISIRVMRLVQRVEGVVGRVEDMFDSQLQAPDDATSTTSDLNALLEDYDEGDDKENAVMESVTQLVYDKPVLDVETSETVQSVFDRMYDARASYSIVKNPDDNSCIGLVDIPSLLRYLLSPRSTDVSIARAIRRCIVVPRTSSVALLMKHMCEGHRCVIIDNEDSTYQISSQRAFIRYLLEHKNERMQRHLLKTLDDLSIGSKQEIITCLDTFTASEAFFMMCAYDITSLPIVDTDGLMCGVIGASDMLYICKDMSRIDLPVVQFVSESRMNAMITRDVSNVVTCYRTDTLHTVLDAMMNQSVHHVYIVDDGLPTGVVSFVDIIRAIA